jgi:hypothetical protein
LKRVGRQHKPRGRAIDVLLLFGILLTLLLPRFMDAQAALLWTEYRASRGAMPPHVAENARQAGRSAARAIDLAAPFPIASDAARLALDLGRSIEPSNPRAAFGLYSEVRGALDRAVASRIRGMGLESVAREAEELQNRANDEGNRQCPTT